MSRGSAVWDLPSRMLVMALCFLGSIVFAASASAAGPYPGAPDPGGNPDAKIPLPAPAGKFFGPHEVSWELPTHGWDAAELAEVGEGLGANTARFTMDWWYLEPTKDHWNEGEWGRYERYYDELTERGIRPMITVSSSPPWARDSSAQNCTTPRNCEFPPAASQYGEWKEFVAEVATRFPEAAAIEIWNEPNLQSFWKPHPDPVRYGQLVAAAYPAIKAADPNMRVLAGALAPAQSPVYDILGNPSRLAMRDFLDDMYPAVKNASDAISFHTVFQASSYGAESLYAKVFDDVRDVRAAHSDTGKKLWVTETGITTMGAIAYTPAQQAAGLLEQYRRIMTMSDVEGMIAHTLADRAELPREDFNRGYGLIESFFPFVPKPAFCAFAGRVEDRAVPYGGCPKIDDDDPNPDPDPDPIGECTERLADLLVLILSTTGEEQKAYVREYREVERQCIPCTKRIAKVKRKRREAQGQRRKRLGARLAVIKSRCAPCQQRLVDLQFEAIDVSPAERVIVLTEHERVRRNCRPVAPV